MSEVVAFLGREFQEFTPDLEALTQKFVDSKERTKANWKKEQFHGHLAKLYLQRFLEVMTFQYPRTMNLNIIPHDSQAGMFHFRRNLGKVGAYFLGEPNLIVEYDCIAGIEDEAVDIQIRMQRYSFTGKDPETKEEKTWVAEGYKRFFKSLHDRNVPLKEYFGSRMITPILAMPHDQYEPEQERIKEFKEKGGLVWLSPFSLKEYSQEVKQLFRAYSIKRGRHVKKLPAKHWEKLSKRFMPIVYHLVTAARKKGNRPKTINDLESTAFDGKFHQIARSLYTRGFMPEKYHYLFAHLETPPGRN